MLPRDGVWVAEAKLNGTLPAETSVVGFIGFHTKTHLEGEKYYADKLLFTNYLCMAVIVTLILPTENEVGI